MIEQQAPDGQWAGPNAARRTSGSLSLGHLLWSHFRSVAARSNAVAQLRLRGPRPALVTAAPVKNPLTFRRQVQDRDPEDILSFFTCASAPRPVSAVGLDTAGLPLELCCALPQAVPDDRAATAAYESHRGGRIVAARQT